jgi:hypothetical protein
VNRRNLALSAAIVILWPAAAMAQDAGGERRAVLATIERLFDGMRRGDSAAVRSTFHAAALLATSVMEDGHPDVRVDTLDAFVTAVGTPHAEVWDERLRNTEVRIDGGLASVWTEYDFYAGTKFSHCGVDAFQLARTRDGWRIIALADTRRRTGCPQQPGSR